MLVLTHSLTELYTKLSTNHMKMYNVFRLSDDGFEQSLGYYKDFDDAIDAVEDYCIKYPCSYVDYREVN